MSNTSQFDMLLLMADNETYADRVPWTFISAFGLQDCSSDLCEAGWEMFKRERRRLSINEIKEYAKRRRKR